jgi:hypothetical protein
MLRAWARDFENRMPGLRKRTSGRRQAHCLTWRRPAGTVTGGAFGCKPTKSPPPEANAALSEMERLDATTHAVNIAEALAYRGEIDQAFAWLDRAYQQRDSSLWTVNLDPLMKNLHGDPRWKAFLRKMKLPE